MRALVYERERQMAFREHMDMPPLKPDEIAVRIAFAGICGSDVHGYLGHDERRMPPLILGHEASGVIEDSKPVVINPLLSCGHCVDCLAGYVHVCRERVLLSIPPRQGCFADTVHVPKSAVVPFDTNLISMEKAALTEPLSCSWHGVCLVERLVEQFSFSSLSACNCLILGGGAIGLGMALVLRHFGVRDIAILEPNRLRHAALKRAGDFDTLSTMNGIPHHSFAVVFDAYGGTVSRETASRFIQQKGVILHIGLAGGNDGLDIRHITLKEVMFVGCYTYTKEEFCATLKAMSEGALGSLDWVDVRPFEKGADAFDDIVHGRCAEPKIMLKISGKTP